MDSEKMESEIGSGTPKTAIIIGAGQRGHVYPYYAAVYPKQLKVYILKDIFFSVL